jgi:hypothetical protein
MVLPHGHHSRFSYGRDFRPNGLFSYSPAFWGAPRRDRARSEAAKAEGMMAGEVAGRNQAMMVGGAILGVIAVGALVWVAAKK